ncbi:MAG: pyruvate kinase [Bacilli bacterium]|nr:pyruvate kinase [Bacilli bacterium]
MKKTKIVCSMGPACLKLDVLCKMIKKGMNVARINCSHADIKNREETVNLIKEARKITGKDIAIMYDTKGPEFRNDPLANNGINLVEGKTIKVVKEHIIGNETMFSVNHPEALDSINIGNVILLENGLMKIEVIEKTNDYLNCKIIDGGYLGNKKSLSVPGVHLSIPFMSDIDKEDIIYACHHEGDFLAASFVTCKEDVQEIKEILKQEKSNMKIIAKIESETGIKNIEDILREVDGIMVARGDLGTECPMEKIPFYQKQLINAARAHAKNVIVATEMLESMKNNSRPTRAEITDVTNAVLEGTDAVMLSGETAVGSYPIETVETMTNICINAEQNAKYNRNYEYGRKNNISEMIAYSTVDASLKLDAKLIIASTMSGYTARKVANIKPLCPILATCSSREVSRSLALCYGVEATVVPIVKTTDEIVSETIKVATEKYNLQKDDIVIITGGFSNRGQKSNTNLMQIEII